MDKFLTRDEFREQVFARDHYKCVICGAPAKDAHHIIERRLWGETGGYLIDNGASVCEEHHIQCEQTTISVEMVREAAGITRVVIPDHLYADSVYDKWGNIILPNGQRTKGELFHDESVQKILKQGGVLHLFTDYVKYPRTHHCSWSPGIGEDDRIIESMDRFINQRVIVTVKLDGECTSLYSDYYHARSIDSRNHPSRNWAKALHAKFAHEIPKAWRLVCENLYAQHSIRYENLDNYLYGISVWNDRNECLPWDETVEWFQLLDLPHVPIMYDGIYNEELIKNLYDEKRDWATKEGYVIRIADKFAYDEFRYCVAKYVRARHINSTKHWMVGQEIVPNKLKS